MNVRELQYYSEIIINMMIQKLLQLRYLDNRVSNNTSENVIKIFYNLQKILEHHIEIKIR